MRNATHSPSELAISSSFTPSMQAHGALYLSATLASSDSIRPFMLIAHHIKVGMAEIFHIFFSLHESVSL